MTEEEHTRYEELLILRSLAEEHGWAKIALLVLSALGTLLALVVIVAILIFKQIVVASILCFFVLNVGVFILARKKVVSIYK